MATARRPNRPLAVAASVAVLSTLCGRHLYGPTGTALNLYIVCLAETSVGKDRPFKAVYELLEACGYGRLHQTAKIFSVTGFEQLVAETPACAAAVDEIATNLLARISNKKASSHEATIKGVLQELWSRSIGDGPFKTTRRAVMPGRPGAPSLRLAISSPSLTLFGASTPQAFYSALTSGNVEDGFMNRFLIAPAAPRAAKVGGERMPVPSAIVEPPSGRSARHAASGGATSPASWMSSHRWPPSASVSSNGSRPTSRRGPTPSRKKSSPSSTPSRRATSYWGAYSNSTVRLASLHAVSREGLREGQPWRTSNGARPGRSRARAR